MSEIPPLKRTLAMADMVAYAGATWDWHRLHYDPSYYTARGLDAPVVDGQMFGALLAAQLRGWLGPAWDLTRLHFRFRSLVFAGETVTCLGTVTGRTAGEVTADLRVEAGDRTAVTGAAVLGRRP